jgi:quercetin dioxygenase-like cupin family protein
MSPCVTNRTCRNGCCMSVTGGRADVPQAKARLPFLNQNGSFPSPAAARYVRLLFASKSGVSGRAVHCDRIVGDNPMSEESPPKALSGVNLRVLSKIDGPVEGFETVIVEIDIPAGLVVGRHSHPGVETIYVLQGSGELTIDGESSRVVARGEAFQVPLGRIHTVRIDDKDAKVCSVLVVEKGKPLVIPA